MAEATVESPPSSSAFYCHNCRIEVQPNIPAYTCSRCDSGFIEEIERDVPPPQSTAEHHNSDFPVPIDFFRLLSEPLRNPPQFNPRHRYNTRQAARNQEEPEDLSDDEDMAGVGPSHVFRFNTSDAGQGQQTFHGIINYVIQHLGRPPLPLILHGNPGDYAWGAGGLDTIISQLLNHLEGTGAPPAQKEKIDNLAKIVIDQSHVDETLQCSICMDDFELEMVVRKLPCDHLYHNECIVKWLEMHGTCPVCRKDLNGEDTSTNEADFTTLIPPTGGGNGGNNGASSSSSSSTSMGPSSSSSFSM